MGIRRLTVRGAALVAGALIASVVAQAPAHAITTYLDSPNFQELSSSLAHSNSRYMSGVTIYGLTQWTNASSTVTREDAATVAFNQFLASQELRRRDLVSSVLTDTSKVVAGFDGTTVRENLPPLKYPRQAAALLRLGKSSASYETSADDERSWGTTYRFPYFQALISSYALPTALLAQFESGVQAGEEVSNTVSRGPNIDDASLVDFGLSVVPGPESQFSSRVLVFTVDPSDHRVVKATTRTAFLDGTGESNVLTYTNDQASDAFWTTRSIPVGATTVNHYTLIAMTNKIAAEGLAGPKARGIGARATQLAVSARTSVTQTLIRRAAVLQPPAGMRVTLITGGVKITATYRSVAGSQCVKAVNGRAVTRIC